MSKPMPSTVSAAIAAEGPLRNLLKAIQRDEVTCNGAQAEWARQLLGWTMDTIDGAEPAGGWPSPPPAEREMRECLHCGRETAARFDSCTYCGLWHSRLIAKIGEANE